MPPPPRAVRYLPFVRTARIWWAIILSVLVLFPLVGCVLGLQHEAIGATLPPKSAIVVNAMIMGRTTDANDDDWLDLEYQVGNRLYRHFTWVPRSYYSQTAYFSYAPITVPDPRRPTDFYIGPPRGNPGLPISRIFWFDGLIAACLAILCLAVEGKRAIEFRLLRHGYATIGTIELESRPEGEVQEVVKITTREGPFKELVGYSTDPYNCPPPGTTVPVIYMPDDPSTMKPLTDFKCCELVR